ncbi:enoyl-CoA hydratase [Parasphingopyxis sp.]|uniref:enoyl-CoA hydratase n=1 Tax=Parasphingopyxis sp. TaxID=1920299 RepID=UPI00261BDF83|nr:enoyl-CoA hydratase [Parasphingopyxis sp.]
MALIEIERCDGYAVLTLNRPEAMNALSAALRAELARTVLDMEADTDIRVLILTGAGERAFTAGLDLKELGSGASSIGEAVDVEDPVTALGRFYGPVIGAINGVAITGGFELALACDVLIASENARFADTHARVGIMPGWGLSQKLSRAIGISRAKELSLTGNFISAEQAERWGLVNRVVPAAELLPQARQLAEDMLSVEPDMLVSYRKLIDDGFAATFGEGLELEQERASANAGVSAEEIEKRRAAVQARGRGQSG